MENDILEALEEAKISNELYLNNIEITDKIWNEIIKLGNLQLLILPNIDKINYNGLEKLQNVYNLSLRDNNLTELPKEILALKNLHILSLANNNLRELPKEILSLKNLEVLYLDDNNFTELPKEILALKNLKELYLRSNNLIELPKEILALKNLEILNIHNNQIINIPFSIFKLKNFYDIHIGNNYIDNLCFEYLIEDTSLKINLRNIFSFNDYEISYQNNSVFFKTEKNYVFIGVSTEYEYISINIYIFGKKDIYKKILLKIKKQIEQWIKKDNIKSVSRHFEYSKKDKYGNKTSVDYNKLIKLKKAKEYSYFDGSGTKIPVSDLLDYIDESNIKLENDWNGTDYLSKIKIKNFKLFCEIEFDLNPKVNIILGHNGFGKTSVLQGITLALLATNNRDKSNEFEKIIKFGNERAEISINYGKNEQREIHIIPNAMHEMQHIDKPEQILLSYGVNLNADMKKFNTDFYKKIVSGEGSLYATKSIFKDYSNDFSEPLSILYELQKDSDLSPELEEMIKFIVDKINDYLDLIPKEEKIELIRENRRFYFNDFNNHRLEFENLSEGYKDHILLISDIFLRIIAVREKLFKDKTIGQDIFTKIEGVIIIDEFDRHLHPIWQRKLLFQLKKDFPKIQFILTTHNIFSLQSAVGATAHEIKLKDGNIYIDSSVIEAENILSIANRFTNLDYDDETQKQLTQLSDIVKNVSKGDIDLAYSDDFKILVKDLLSKGEEINSITSSFILRLNNILKHKNQKAFSL